VLKSQGKLEQAVSHYRQAVRLKPDYVEAYNNLGNALRLQGKLDEAVDYLRRALALNPNIADIHYNLGLALQSLNEPEEAMTRFRQAIRIKPDWPSPLDSLASLLATTSDPRLRDPNEAIVLAQRAVELSQRRNASILDTLASAYAAAGRFNDAITTAQTALDLAAANHNEQLAAQIGENLQLYKQQKSR
jgi:tetratricopeptide (TPR) repeat protein